MRTNLTSVLVEYQSPLLPLKRHHTLYQTTPKNNDPAPTPCKISIVSKYTTFSKEYYSFLGKYSVFIRHNHDKGGHVQGLI